MMPPARLASRRSALMTAGAVVAVVAVVTGVAVASGGYAAQRVDLGDAAVWVASDQSEAIGRANTAVLELNSVVETGSTGAVVVQDGPTVLVLDPDRASVGVVDATTSTLTDTVAVPPDEPTIALAGSQVVVVADGEVWTVPAAEFAEFDSEDEPMFAFGAGAVTSVDPDGTLFAYTPSTGEVRRVDAAGAATVAEQWQLEPTDDIDMQITSVAGRWAVLDIARRTLFLQGRSDGVDLSAVLEAGQTPLLQMPSLTGDEVAIAHRGGLIAVGLDDGETSQLVDGRLYGDPAAPVMHDGCLHAAWSIGSAWRSCASPGELELEGGAGATDLAFLANGDALVLNDRTTGKTWAASADYGLIDNWTDLLEIERDEETVEQNDPDTDPTVEKSQVPPVAVDDEFGARPGRSTLLPVLLNDYDANGDVLVVDSVDGELPPGAKLDLVSENQQLQLTLDDGASGVITFGYVVDDGRGGTAHATVHVTVRGPDENSPPQQQRPTHATIASGGRVSTPVLGDWIDPDGDPIFLQQADVETLDAVSWTAEGVVVFDEVDGSGSERTVSLVVSDGRDEAVGVLEIEVHAPGDVPIVAEPFVALATQGQEIRIEPLLHVRGGSAPVRLTAVPAKPEAAIVPDFDGGTFRFTSDAVGTHLLEYTVTDGTKTETGVVRVDVSAPPERDTTPITVPHTAFLRLQQPVDIDVLATDIDPTGGVLVVTGLGDTEAAEAEGAVIEIIDHRILRVTLTRPLETGSTAFGYRVSNGLAEAEGEVTLVEVPEPVNPQAPVAAPDTISARTGDVVDVAVLANDEHPDGLSLTLAPTLVTEPAAGLLFVDGDRLRYFAPDTAGEFEATYRVDAEGQFANATVSISVREADPESNSPPVPSTVTARVIAGETVRIPIPLGGVDPDGDSVQLIGLESNPDRGSVIERGADWLEYQAGEYSPGTDSFQYTVIDALGARATGWVRVGIAPRVDGAHAPIASDDVVTVRPGRTISVRVLENDSDPDGGSLQLVGVEETTDGATAVIVDDHLELTIPDAEGQYGFMYTVENEHLSTAQSWVTVEARDDAPLSRPEASDTVLGLSDILDLDRIDVPVLQNVFLADADVGDLTVELVDGYDRGAEVRPDGTIRVDVEDRRRIIPFSVAHPEDPSVTAHAFIWVPGRGDALPQLRSDAPRVHVTSGEEVLLELEDFVIAASGRPVRLTDAANVRASNGDGSQLDVDEDTLRYRSAEGYFGPASLSFTVTDGESATDPEGRTGTIVIPIDVLPTENQPPVFSGGVIDFEPGQAKSIDLVELTDYPYPDAVGELEFEVLPPSAEGFRVSLDDQELTVEAEEAVSKDAPTTIAIGVADDAGEGRPGRIDVRVVPSTRPLAQPAPDSAVVARGTTTSIDVLANDRATNPFPDTPLRVVDVSGLDTDSLPDGVSIKPSEDRTTLAVTVESHAAPVNTTLQYQVADATDDPSRYAWGTVTISVQDRPDPVTSASVTGFGDGTLDVVFGAGGFNNSPITGYEIQLLDPSNGAVLRRSDCAATTCTVATPGNGQSNAVVVQVQARNGIGLSDPVEVPGPIWSDVIPPAPTGLRALPLDGRLRIEWDPVSSGPGSAVGSYVVTVAGVSSEVSAADACTATACSTESQALENGSQVPFTVSARNQAYPALTAWTEAGGTGMPFGSPVAGDIAVNGDALAGTVTVSWSPFAGNGDAIAGYFVQRLVEGESSVPTGPQACTVTSPAPGTVVAPASGGTVAEVAQVGPDASSVQFTGTGTESARYSFLVWGYNRAGCVNTEVVSTIVRPAPGTIGSVQSDMQWRTTETWDRYIGSVDPNAWTYQIVLVDQGGAQVPGSEKSFNGTGWLRDIFARPFGEAVRFQVRSCSVWGSCGPWSDVLPANATPSLTFALPSRIWDEGSMTWSWTAAPDNSGLPTSFRCGVDGDDTGQIAQTATTCQIPGAVPGGRVWLDVEVAGVTARYESS